MTWPLVIQYIHYMQAWPFEPRTRASPRALIRRDAHFSTRHNVCCESIKSCVNFRIYPTKNVRIARKKKIFSSWMAIPGFDILNGMGPSSLVFEGDGVMPCEIAGSIEQTCSELDDLVEEADTRT